MIYKADSIDHFLAGLSVLIFFVLVSVVLFLLFLRPESTQVRDDSQAAELPAEVYYSRHLDGVGQLVKICESGRAVYIATGSLEVVPDAPECAEKN